MSKTDKTNPWWVKIRRREGNVKPLKEYHEHRGGHKECDIDAYLPVPRCMWPVTPQTNCELWMRHSDNHMFYGRRPNRETRKALGFEGTNRMRLRKLRIQWKQEPIREDIDSTLHAPRNAKYVRDPWCWD